MDQDNNYQQCPWCLHSLSVWEGTVYCYMSTGGRLFF